MENMVKIGRSMEEKGAREKNTGAAKVQSPGVEHSELQNEDRDLAILHELRGLRKEHADAVGENKRALARLEMNRKELMDRTSSLEQRVAQMEERVGNTEDGMAQMERGATFLFRETTKLAEKCNDLELRMRRKNIQIHGIPEGVEKNDTISFITQFIKSKIQFTEGMVFWIKSAHRR
ncbi:hypothetical protein XENOCAPTIV_003100 [Xenoophorus captivus]|uniref:Uncharacterized protein n=1 Tax=Xenoophorus captivus TaxID=1517983 RepID=A0ABV0SCD5_9TELE